MQEREIFILGAGGQAKETFAIYKALCMQQKVLGFLEENCLRVGANIHGKLINDVSVLNEMSEKSNLSLIAAIGSTKRHRLIEELAKKEFVFETVIHPSAVYSDWVDFGRGTTLSACTVLTTDIIIGEHVIINYCASIGHDSSIGSFSTLSPGSRISGNVRIGREVFIGNNASVNEGLTVGNGAVVAAGAVVKEDVPPMTLAAGVPARFKKIYKCEEEKPW